MSQTASFRDALPGLAVIDDGVVGDRVGLGLGPCRDTGGRVLSPGRHWRVMLGLSIVPGVLLILIAMAMPDTPRWYLRAGRRAEAKATLAKTIGGANLDGRLDTMQAELAKTAGVKWKDVFAPALRRALWAGIGLAVFQQVTGINAVIYYSDKIFSLAGFTTPMIRPSPPSSRSAW
jgi:MFS transporter, SP family, galactose:H+ symporter